MPSWLAASSSAAFGLRSVQIRSRSLPGVSTSISTKPRAIRPMPTRPNTMLRPAPLSRSCSTVSPFSEVRRDRTRTSEGAQVPLPLVRGDFAPVLLPLGALVAQKEVEDVLAEHLGDQLGLAHHVDRLGQVFRQRLVAHRA